KILERYARFVRVQGHAVDRCRLGKRAGKAGARRRYSKTVELDASLQPHRLNDITGHPRIADVGVEIIRRGPKESMPFRHHLETAADLKARVTFGRRHSREPSREALVPGAWFWLRLSPASRRYAAPSATAPSPAATPSASSEPGRSLHSGLVHR